MKKLLLSAALSALICLPATAQASRSGLTDSEIALLFVGVPAASGAAVAAAASAAPVAAVGSGGAVLLINGANSLGKAMENDAKREALEVDDVSIITNRNGTTTAQ